MANIPNLLFGRTLCEFSILINIFFNSQIFEKYIVNMFSGRHVQSIIDHLLCYGKLFFSSASLSRAFNFFPTHKWHTLLPTTSCVSPDQSCWSSWWPFVHGDWSNGLISPLSCLGLIPPLQASQSWHSLCSHYIFPFCPGGRTCPLESHG